LANAKKGKKCVMKTTLNNVIDQPVESSREFRMRQGCKRRRACPQNSLACPTKKTYSTTAGHMSLYCRLEWAIMLTKVGNQQSSRNPPLARHHNTDHLCSTCDRALVSAAALALETKHSLAHTSATAKKKSSSSLATVSTGNALRRARTHWRRHGGDRGSIGSVAVKCRSVFRSCFVCIYKDT